MKGRQNSEAPDSSGSFFFLCIQLVKYNKFWRQQVENQTMWRDGGAGVWSPPALETAGSLKCTTAQLHISFDCRFVVCAGRCFELLLEMKANLVHSVSTADRCCLFASGTIKGCQTIIYSIELNHAGLSIMYNLSYNTSQDTTLSQLHFNLMPLFLFFFLRVSMVNVWSCKGESLLSPAVTLWYLAAPAVRITPLSACFSPLLVSLSLKTPDQRTFLSPPSPKCQPLLYKMKQYYKPNINILPLDSPTVNI